MDFHLTKHAASRAIDMALDPDEIRLCLESPEIRKRANFKRHCILYIRGRIAMPVDEYGAVTTILWNRGDDMGRFTRDTAQEMRYIRDQAT